MGEIPIYGTYLNWRVLIGAFFIFGMKIKFWNGKEIGLIIKNPALRKIMAVFENKKSKKKRIEKTAYNSFENSTLEGLLSKYGCPRRRYFYKETHPEYKIWFSGLPKDVQEKIESLTNNKGAGVQNRKRAAKLNKIKQFKLQKTYETFSVTREDREELERLLDSFCEFMKNDGRAEFTHKSDDGRKDSLDEEPTIVKLFSDFVARNSNNRCDETKPRAKGDVMFKSFPINIKITAGATNDNTMALSSVIYALFGKDYGTMNWKTILECVKTWLSTGDYNKEMDYYFLIVNKNDNKDMFWTSMKRLKQIEKNASNPPFQCNWNENREKIDRTWEDSFKFLWGKTRESYEDMQKQIDAVREIDNYINQVL